MQASKVYKAEQYYLLKAESLCADLLSNGFTFDDLVLEYLGSFRKSYRNDIEGVSVAKGTDKPVLLKLNRDGIYDRLPEGLFHQTRGSNQTPNVGTMVDEFRRFREEERMARKFFQPVEQELFHYAVKVEQEERKLEFGIMNGDPGQAFYRFWDIDTDLPSKAAATLVLIMPWLKQIKGDKSLTAKALSMTLGKEVSVEERVVYGTQTASTGFVLGQEGALSIDTVCGNSWEEPLVQWLFIIGNVHDHEAADFVPTGPLGRFLKRFEELFLPLHIDGVFELESLSAADVDDRSTILGYGYYL